MNHPRSDEQDRIAADDGRSSHRPLLRIGAAVAVVAGVALWWGWWIPHDGEQGGDLPADIGDVEPVDEPAEDAASDHVEVTAVGQTDPVAGSGDDADDPAIWVHPDDPDVSLILGTNKNDDRGGLHVYDLDGSERQFLAVGKLNNVDVRYGLSGVGDVVAATNRDRGRIDFFAVDPDSRTVEATDSLEVDRDEPYGFCLGRDGGAFYAFATFQTGHVQQYRLSGEGGRVSGELVRTIDVGSQVEGCAVDDEHGVLYLSEEAKGVHAFGLAPSSGGEAFLVDRTDSDGELTADVEGVAIYPTADGGGYLLVSSQGASRINIYRRGGDHAYLGSFVVVGGDGVDAVSKTDGLEVAAAPLGPYEQGLVVIHDGENADAPASNYKLVRWDEVAAALGLQVDTSAPPRPGTATNAFESGSD